MKYNYFKWTQESKLQKEFFSALLKQKWLLDPYLATKVGLATDEISPDRKLQLK